MSRVFALANQKGGVGRTTTTLGVARALVEQGQPVVVIDADPQANATKILGFDPDAQASLADLLDQPTRGLGSVTVDTTWGFGLVPANRTDLNHHERTFRIGDEFSLQRALEGTSPDLFVLIDCPPSLGILTLMALVAAQRVLLVTEASYNSLTAIDAFLDTVQRVATRHNTELTIGGVIVNQFRRTTRQLAHLAQLDDAFPGLVWRPVVPLRDAAEAPASTGLPLSELRQDGVLAVKICYDAYAERLVALEAADHV